MSYTVNIIPNLGISTFFENIFGKFTDKTSDARKSIKDGATKTMDFIYDKNMILVIVVIVIFIIYFFLFGRIDKKAKLSMNTKSVSGLGSSAGEMLSKTKTNTKSSKSPFDDSTGIGFIEVTLWGLFIFLILMNGLQLFLSLDVKAFVSDLFSGKPEVEIEVKSPYLPKPKTSKVQEKEVFHITKNVYNYKQAQALCKAYDSELASYDQVKNAHEKGAEWCAYGWSKDQLALFPTQKQTYEKLQKVEGHENDCGRPGINGGYIANPNAKFGVNCYGYKPGITPMESEVLANALELPKSDKEKEINKMVDKFKREIPNIILSPFNRTTWSRM